MARVTPPDRNETITAFRAAVNMTPAQLRKWLESAESHSVGQARSGSESVGHASGRRIVEIKGRKQRELSDDDIAHMRKVVGYVKRHSAQRPDGDVATSRWRYSLMNWGHDPLKRR
jgi:hypothetical protein